MTLHPGRTAHARSIRGDPQVAAVESLGGPTGSPTAGHRPCSVGDLRVIVLENSDPPASARLEANVETFTDEKGN